MHKIADKEFTLNDFSCEHLNDEPYHRDWIESAVVDEDITSSHKVWMTPLDILRCTIEMLNAYRKSYLETKDKQDWWQMIQLLPSSYNQRRTVMLNYEVLANIYKSRRTHKLDEWVEFCKWIESLPYAELITGPSLGNVPICNEITDSTTDILTAPTVDAVSVVRCKDCAVPHNKYTGCPKLNGLVTPPDFYCPFGEQK